MRPPALGRQACLFLLLAASAIWPGEAPSPPLQPTTGPGGASCPHGGVRKTGPIGHGARAYYLYEPQAPVPASAPVVVLLHGYLGVYPRAYGGWIEHLVLRGHIVIFPVYQTDLLSVNDFTGNALAAVTDALALLAREPGRVRPAADGRWAVVGHSLGCPLGVNLALAARDAGLGSPRALFLTTPGDGHTGVMRSPAGLKDLLLLVVVADQDAVVGADLGRRIVREASGLPPADRNLIVLHADPPLLAGHFGPLAIDGAYDSSPDFLQLFRDVEKTIVPPGLGHANAFTWYGYWKWCDALLDAAFHGRDRAYALGNTREQRSMGVWSDGRAVREPSIEIPH